MKQLKPLPRSCKLRTALSRARTLGCTVIWAPGQSGGGGEMHVILPNGDRLVLNKRRSDAQLVLISALNKLLPPPTPDRPVGDAMEPTLQVHKQAHTPNHTPPNQASSRSTHARPKRPKIRLSRRDLSALLREIESLLPVCAPADEATILRARAILIRAGLPTTLSSSMAYLYSQRPSAGEESE